MNAEYVDFPLHDAAKRGNIEFVKECIKNSVIFSFFSLPCLLFLLFYYDLLSFILFSGL